MLPPSDRRKVHFVSGGARCAAWHYPGTNGACVVMAGGLAVTKEPGTDRFARRFNQAGYTVLAFDYRCFGESDGRPRQVARINDQLADWRAAIDWARGLPGVEPGRLVVWGHSSSGGHVLSVAVRTQVAAAIALAPLVDGPAIAPNAMRHQTPLASLRFATRAARDALGGLIGRNPLLVPLAGERGTLSALSSPDALKGSQALDPDGRYPDWRQEVAARSALRMGFYRPGRHAGRVRCPLLVMAYQDDDAAPPEPAVKVARSAPRGELASFPGGHYDAFMAGHERAVEVQLSFLSRCMPDEFAAPPMPRPQTAPAAPGR